MIARLAVLAAAAVALVLLASSLRAHDACDGARETIFGVTLGKRPVSRQPGALRMLRARCRGTTALTAAAGALFRQGRVAEARALAAEAARREPDNAQAWVALAVTSARDHPALARRASERARRLSPRDPPPVPRRSRPDVPGVGKRAGP